MSHKTYITDNRTRSVVNGQLAITQQVVLTENLLFTTYDSGTSRGVQFTMPVQFTTADIVSYECYYGGYYSKVLSPQWVQIITGGIVYFVCWFNNEGLTLNNFYDFRLVITYRAL